MLTKYSDLDIHFHFENYTLNALNIIFERFTRTIPAHSHGSGCYEIHYIPRGYGKLEADGNFYEITPGTLYVTGPHVEHAQSPVLQNPMQEYCVYLKVHKSSKKSEDSPLMDTFSAMPFWFGKDTQNLLPLMEQLFDELKTRRTGYIRQVELLLSQLLIALIRNYEHSKSSSTNFSLRNLGDSKSVIIEEYFLYEYSSLSLDTLAGRLKLSARQTQRLLQEYYGKTFQQKKTEARMSAAVIFLGEKSRSITSIADALGYSSPEHFSNEFRKYYEVSPRMFRSRL